MTIKVPANKNPLIEAYQVAAENPGQMVVLGSSKEHGNEISLSGTTIMADGEQKALFGSERNDGPFDDGPQIL